MCGRFTLRASASEIAAYFELMHDLVAWDAPRFNIARTQSVLAVRATDAGREAVRLHWGLIPPWEKDTKRAASLVNARSETVAKLPSFRAAFRNRRCLIPASGFYDSKPDGKSTKTPHLISLHNEALFAFAGLWESWSAPDGSVVESCTILTTSPNELVATIHDRMPVILRPADFSVWLDPRFDDVSALSSLLVPYPADEMQAEPVSRDINNYRNEFDPRLPSGVAGRTVVQRGLFDGIDD